MTLQACNWDTDATTALKIAYAAYVEIMQAELQSLSPASPDDYWSAWLRVTTETPTMCLSNNHFAAHKLHTKTAMPVQIFAIQDCPGIAEITDTLLNTDVIKANVTDYDAYKMIKFFPLKATAKKGSMNTATVTVPYSTTLMQYLRLEKFMAVGSTNIGSLLTAPLTSSTEVKLVEHKAALQRESPGCHYLYIVLHTMGCDELSAYLWTMNSLQEQQVGVMAMRWDLCHQVRGGRGTQTSTSPTSTSWLVYQLHSQPTTPAALQSRGRSSRPPTCMCRSPASPTAAHLSGST